MRFDPGPEHWRTTAIADAERSLDAALDGALATVREAESVRLAMLAVEDPIDEEGARFFRDFVTGRGRTPEWEPVIARIDAGELTWQGVFSAKYVDDVQVAAAHASIQSMLPIDPPSAEASPAPQPPAASKRPRLDDEEYFDDFSVRRRSR